MAKYKPCSHAKGKLIPIHFDDRLLTRLACQLFNRLESLHQFAGLRWMSCTHCMKCMVDIRGLRLTDI